MAWQEVDKMSLRKEFILDYERGHLTMKALCERFQISRTTGYKLLSRYKQSGITTAITEASKRPHHSPKATHESIVQKIYEIREKHPAWGGRKIKVLLEREGIKDVPSASTISGLLRKGGYIGDIQTTQRHWQRFEHANPNDLWQVDFKGHFAYENGRCHPLTILDDHSRYSVGLFACENEQGETVKRHFINTFEHFGLPKRINFDNGSPWGSKFASCRYTSFTVWLIEHEVSSSYSRPGHPQTNGKDERFHRTLKDELISPSYFRYMSEIQSSFDSWRNIYNHERPHEALSMEVPGNRYTSSYRSYSDSVRSYEYSPEYQVFKVDLRGRIHLNGRMLFVGMPFSERLIGLRPNHIDGEYSVYFRHQKLASINLKYIDKGTGMNIYSKTTLGV